MLPDADAGSVDAAGLNLEVVGAVGGPGRSGGSGADQGPRWGDLTSGKVPLEKTLRTETSQRVERKKGEQGRGWSFDNSDVKVLT